MGGEQAGEVRERKWQIRHRLSGGTVKREGNGEVLVLKTDVIGLQLLTVRWVSLLLSTGIG